MALVGEAHVVVRAITKNVERDIKRSFSGLNSVGSRSGDSLGRSFSRGFNRQVNANTFKRVADGIRSLVPGAEAARRAFSSLVRSGYTLGTALSSIVGGISAVIGGLGALGGAALGAMGSVAALGNVLFSVFAGMQVAKMALGGVGKAISAANNPTGGGGGSKGSAGTAGTSNAAAVEQANAAARAAAAERVAEAERALALVIERNREDMVEANNDVRDAQLELNEALKEGREEIQQLGFDAEDAALAEQKAAIELGRAREALQRVQDLPPNSRARQEAELAFAEAELNLRKAKDRSADLNKEQDRLARTGARGTAGAIAAADALARAEAARSKAARDAMRDETEATQDLLDAKKEAASAGQEKPTSSAGSAGTAGSAGGGGVDPYAGLNAAQEAFARFIVSLKPKFDELNRIAAESFLPKLQTAIETLMTKAFPVVAMGVGIIGSAMGDAAIAIANAMTSAINLERLGALFVSSGVIIQGLGNIIGSLWGIALSVMTAAIPLAERFVAFMETRFKGIDEYLNTTEGTAALNNFMTLAGDAMAQIGRILDNVFGGIGDIIMANLGPGTGGQYMLDWLEGATQKFDDIGNNPALQQFFLDVSVNATKVMGSIGALIGELIKLGDNQAIGITFDKLAEGAPIVGRIIEKTLEAGPVLADLVLKILDIIDAFTDTGAIQTFFGVLDTVAGVVRDMFANESLQGILTITGRVLAFVSALGLISSIGATGFRIVAGGVTSLMNVMSILTTGISGVVRVMGLLSIANIKSAAETAILHGMYAKDAILKGAAAAKTLALAAAETVANGVRKAAAAVQWLLNAAMTANPVGLIIAGIVALVAALVWFFTQTELGQAIWTEFTRFLTEAWANISAVATTVFTELGNFFSEVWDNIVGFVTGAVDFIINLFLTWHPLGIIIANWEPIAQFFTDIWNSIVAAVQTAIQFVMDVIVNITNAISTVWNAIWTGISNFFGTIWNGIVTFVTNYINTVRTIIETVINVISTIWNAIWTGISNFFGTIWNGIVTFVTNYINTVRTIITTVVNVISTVWGNIWKSISDFFSTIWTGIVAFVTNYINTVRTIITNVVNTIQTIWNNIWNGISSFFAGIWAGIIATVQNVGTVFGNVFSNVANVVEGAFNGIVSVVKGVINNIINLVNGAISGINGIVNTVGGALGFSVTIPKIPRLAKGGTVMPSAGGSIVNVAEAGRPERVEPLDPNGLSARDHAIMDKLTGTRGGVNIKIEIVASEGMDKAELAAEVGRELAYQLRKGGF